MLGPIFFTISFALPPCLPQSSLPPLPTLTPSPPPTTTTTTTSLANPDLHHPHRDFAQSSKSCNALLLFLLQVRFAVAISTPGGRIRLIPGAVLAVV